MSKGTSALHHVRLVSCASAPGRRNVTVEVEGSCRVTLHFRADDGLDIAQHVLLAQRALQVAWADGRPLTGR